VQVSILDLNQSVVATYSYNWLIDTTPPTGNALTANAGNGSASGASGSWDWRRPGNGILPQPMSRCEWYREGIVYVYRSDGSLYSTTQMQYDVTGKKMYHTYSKNTTKGVGIPDSNLDEDFTAKVEIYDNAGNRRTLPIQLFRYDNVLGEMTLWAVHDPQTSASVVPGVSGYPAYSAGMTINENPIRLVYRLPKSNYRAYAEGGLQFKLLCNTKGDCDR
jgi:hypothetical protein